MSSEEIWTPERKAEWFKNNPCRRKDGTVTDHKRGYCKNCGGCMMCEQPIFCPDHVKKDPPAHNKRVRLPGNLIIGGLMSPTKKLRRRTPQDAAEITPNNMVNLNNKTVEEKLNEYDELAKKEKAEGNLLGHRYFDRLNRIEDLPDYTRKAQALGKIVKEQMNQICKGDPKKELNAIKLIANELYDDPAQLKDRENLVENCIKLLTVGSTKIRQVIVPLFLSSFRDRLVQSTLLSHGYDEARKKQVAANKAKVAAAAGSKRKREDNDGAVRQFKKPFSNHTSNATHRNNFQIYHLQGLDVPAKIHRTKIKDETFGEAVSYIYFNSEYRPGQLRQTKLKGFRLYNMPVYRRYTAIDDLFAEYRLSHLKEEPMGYNNFRETVNALTLKGGFNQALSYYYTDFIEFVALLEMAQKRMLEIAKEVEASEQAIELINRFGRQTKLASRYLRHQFYARLKDHDPNNLYCSAKWALGSKDVSSKRKPKPDETDPLLLVLTLEPLVCKIADELEGSLELGSNLLSKEQRLADEIASFRPMADILKNEFLHYTKHVLRGWWQETQMDEMKEALLLEEPGTIFITLDHKSKTLPRKKKEAMTEYFGKHGMSDLGCMMVWLSEGNEGTYTWFKDIIMNNTKGQKAKDLMPGIEAVLDELESVEFLDKYSLTSGQDQPTKVVLVSDNALKSKAHTPFIALQNSRRTIKITDWVNNEAQRGKSFLDTHFRYVNLQIEKAVLAKNLNLSCPERFFECMEFNGGIRSSSVLLLQQEKDATKMHELCFTKEYQNKFAGISKVHHISWGDETIVHRHFTNMKSISRGYRKFDSARNLPKTDIASCGTILKKHYCDSEALFLPFKLKPEETINAFHLNGITETRPPRGTFAERVYMCAGIIHSRGITPTQLYNKGLGECYEEDYRRSTEEEKEIKELIAGAKEMIEDMSSGFEFPPKLARYWAMKRDKTWMTFNEDVLTELRKLYDEGKGHKNSDLRYSAEKAVPTLQQIYARQWDQRAVITAKKVKSIFSKWSREGKKAVDNQPRGSVRVDEDEDDDDDRSETEETQASEHEESELIDDAELETETQWIDDLGFPLDYEQEENPLSFALDEEDDEDNEYEEDDE